MLDPSSSVVAGTIDQTTPARPIAASADGLLAKLSENPFFTAVCLVTAAPPSSDTS